MKGFSFVGRGERYSYDSQLVRIISSDDETTIFRSTSSATSSIQLRCAPTPPTPVSPILCLHLFVAKSAAMACTASTLLRAPAVCAGIPSTSNARRPMRVACKHISKEANVQVWAYLFGWSPIRVLITSSGAGVDLCASRKRDIAIRLAQDIW